MQKLIEYLEGFLTERRKKLFYRNILHRTRYITVVLEDIYQPHNASAVLRTCDCFGIQDVHIIENRNKYQINPDVALGSNQWLSLFKYNTPGNNTVSTLEKLRTEGYRIVATTPHSNDTELQNFNLDKGKVALLFGTELRGLSEEAINNSDEFLKIPMYGFTESFNISVSAAIILHFLTQKLRNSDINWQLDSNEKNAIILNWIKTSVKNSDGLIKAFYQNH